MPDPLRVLVVEDCRDTADSTAMILDAWGMEASIAYDGRSALATATEFFPDIVLLDIGLADMSGLAVARALRESDRFGRTMIVVMSGFVAPDDRELSIAAGCQHHIAKPVELPRLHELLLDGIKEFRRNDPANACATRD
jgi:CheY-like chemotaxis protein